MNHFRMVIVIIIWIGCSSITQVANKKVLNERQLPTILVFSQMLFGTFVHLIASLCKTQDTLTMKQIGVCLY